MQVHKHCTEVGLTEDEQEVRRQALYIIENLNLVNLAMRLCDFKDIHMAVEAKQVSPTGSSRIVVLLSVLSAIGEGGIKNVRGVLADHAFLVSL